MTVGEIVLAIIAGLLTVMVTAVFLKQQANGKTMNLLNIDNAVIKEKLNDIAKIRESMSKHETMLALHGARLTKAENDLDAWHDKHRELRKDLENA